MTARERYMALRRQARADGRATDELLTLYALEGCLRRLAASRYADSFVLKGGVLLAAFDTRRPTRDVDMQAVDFPVEEEAIAQVVTEVLGITIDDGLTFNTSTLTSQPIREGDEYAGLRIGLDATLASAKLKPKLDISAGDPIVPGPQQIVIPPLLDTDEPITMRGFPLPMALAEKLVTAMQRGTANTRWRDFADVHLLTQTNRVDPEALRTAIAAVAAHRGVDLRTLGDVLDGFAEGGQDRWLTWVRKQGLLDRLPSSFAEVLATCAAISDPLISDLRSG